MTDAEKKRMLAIVRAAEFLYSENLALKTVLFSYPVPESIWKKKCEKLTNDPELSPQVHAKFQHLYDEIEHSRDESEAFRELLKALPKPKKDWN
jgi:hypothetical protein